MRSKWKNFELIKKIEVCHTICSNDACLMGYAVLGIIDGGTTFINQVPEYCPYCGTHFTGSDEIE